MRISVRISVGSIAVTNVSRKNSRAAMRRSPSWLRHTSVAREAMRTAGQSAEGSACAHEPPIVPQLRTCGSPMPPAASCSSGMARGDGLGLEDLPVSRPGADPELVARSGIPSMPAEVADVHEQRRLRKAQLQEGNEAVASGEDLGFALALLQDPERVGHVRRPNVIERCWDHRRGALLTRSRRPRAGRGAPADHAGAIASSSLERPGCL